MKCRPEKSKTSWPKKQAAEDFSDDRRLPESPKEIAESVRCGQEKR